MEQRICGMLITEYESTERALSAVESMKNCPRLLLAGAISNKTYTVFVVPELMRWWLEYPAENPEVLGAKRVEVLILEKLAYPDEFTLRLPETKMEVAPCGAKCNICPMRDRYNCPRCPATVYSQ